ncbi:lysophospholipid acyltransferase family protein [Caldilinea sp.]|uniref:lysophospholipid acyltransferase family protein n=1 Tax=Caldilinea sp. TaxID=2293560 RepID=UPI002C795DF6|nr:lysophospholipid acyltransferase family protein [Caldilinea sp.]
MIPPKDSTWVWRMLHVVATLIRIFYLRLRVEGRENVPRTGGCVYAINHNIGPDYVIVGYVSPRQVFYMAKSEIFDFHPWLAALVAGAGAFPVQRGKGDRHAIEQAANVVRGGKIVGMFPEGTRSRNGQLQRGKTGMARIAMLAQAPIVPVVVINAEPVLRDVLKFKRRPLVTVRFGAPVPATGNVENSEEVRRLTTTVMLALAALLPPERHGYYVDAAAVHHLDRIEFR